MRAIKIFFSAMVLIMSLFFVAIGMMMYSSFVTTTERGEKTLATVEEILYIDEDMLVSYQVNGIDYLSELGYYSSTLSPGDQIEIYYDIENPADVSYMKKDIINEILLFPIIGGIIAILCIISIVRDIKKINIFFDIHKRGNEIIANYKRTVKNGFLTYMIECEWNGLDGKTYIFKSSKLLWNPSPVIMKYDIKEIPVKISKKNMNHYYVDTSRIAQLAVAENMEMETENAEFVDEIKRLNGDVSFKIDPEMTYGFRNDNDEGAIKYKK